MCVTYTAWYKIAGVIVNDSRGHFLHLDKIRFEFSVFARQWIRSESEETCACSVLKKTEETRSAVNTPSPLYLLTFGCLSFSIKMYKLKKGVTLSLPAKWHTSTYRSRRRNPPFTHTVKLLWRGLRWRGSCSSGFHRVVKGRRLYFNFTFLFLKCSHFVAEQSHSV